MSEILEQRIVQVPAIDPHLQNVCASDLIVPCKLGPSNIQYMVSTNLSEGSSNSMQFQPPVHPNMICSSQWLLSSTITVAYSFLNSSAVTAYPLIENGNGLCSAPLMSSCQNIKLTINSSSVDNELDFLRNQLDLRMHDEEDLKNFEFSPLQVDNTDRYSNFMLKRHATHGHNDNYYPQGEVTFANPAVVAVNSGLRVESNGAVNELLLYNSLFSDDNVMNGSSKGGWSRGSFYPVAETGNIAFATTAAAGTGTIVYQVAEFLNHPLLQQYSTSSAPKSLFNMTSLNVNISLHPLQQLRRIFRTIANEAALYKMTITGVTFSNATLTIPYAITDLQKLRRNCIVPFFQRKYYNTDTVNESCTIGTPKTVSSNTQILNTIPHYVAVWVCPIDIVNPADLANSLCDWNFRIDGISIDYANQNNLMQNASPAQLYQMTKKNGMKTHKWTDVVGRGVIRQCDTWAHTTSYVNADLNSGNPLTLVAASGKTVKLPGGGSWVLLAVGEDIVLPTGLTPGMAHNANFAIRVNYTNNSQTTRTGSRLNYQFYDKYFFEIVVGGSSSRNGVIDRQVVEDGISEMNAPSNKLQYNDAMMVGGGLFGDLKQKLYKFLPTLKSGLSSVSQFASKIDHPVAHAIGDVSGVGASALSNLGFGKKSSLSKKYC